MLKDRNDGCIVYRGGLRRCDHVAGAVGVNSSREEGTMSDFLQTGPIATLHLLGDRDMALVEQQIENASRTRPIALVLPCLISEMDGPALKVIMSALERVEYLREIVVTLGPASEEDFQRACSYFRPLIRNGRRVRIIWNDGPQGDISV